MVAPATTSPPVPHSAPPPPGSHAERQRTVQRIVVLGGGFGGLYTVQRLEKRFKHHAGVEITLVSRNNYFLMTPFLFEAGSGILEPRHAVTPVRRLFKKARFVEAEIDRIDFENRRVFAHHETGAHEYELEFDHVVLALGGVTNRSMIPGSEHAIAFKTLGDAIFLRNAIIDLFERADVEEDPEIRRRLLTIVVIGGGLVGVELMGELTEFIDNLLRSYPRIPREMVRFVLVEASPRILPEMEEDLAKYAADRLWRRGVSLITGTRVQRIERGRVWLPAGTQVAGAWHRRPADGAGGEGARDGQEMPRARQSRPGVRAEFGAESSVPSAQEHRQDADATVTVIEAETILLAAGVTANPLLKDLPVEKAHSGRVVVDSAMRSKDKQYLWALGDCALIPNPRGGTYPPLAQHALREARVLADNIAAVVNGHDSEIKPFVYETMGMLASLGHYDGVGRVGPVKIKGFIAWWVWRTYYMLQMPRLERKLRVILDWTVALFFKNDVAKLDLFGETHPTRKVKADAPVEVVR